MSLVRLLQPSELRVSVTGFENANLGIWKEDWV